MSSVLMRIINNGRNIKLVTSCAMEKYLFQLICLTTWLSSLASKNNITGTIAATIKQI
jgi:hypothetical protein